MKSIARARRPVKPVHGTCAWELLPVLPAEPGARGAPGAVRINGVVYGFDPFVLFPDADTRVVAGVRLTKADGTAYDVDTAGPAAFTCDCPDFVFRRHHADPRGCKHCCALRALMPRLAG